MQLTCGEAIDLCQRHVSLKGLTLGYSQTQELQMLGQMDATANEFGDNAGGATLPLLINKSQHAPPEARPLEGVLRVHAWIGKYWTSMENRTARLTLLIDPTKKQIFEEICTLRDLTPSQVVRQMIREYVQKHGTPEQLQRMPVNTRMKD